MIRKKTLSILIYVSLFASHGAYSASIKIKDSSDLRSECDSSGEINLSKLVDSSDVIIKAFAGDGSYIRGHDNGSLISNEADFLIKLLPQTIYKGGGLLKHLELMNTHHYFIIKGDLNLNATHKHSLRRQSRTNTRIRGNGDAIKCNLSRSNIINKNRTVNDSIINNRDSISNVLKEILPTQLIVFGRLDNRNNLLVDPSIGLLHWNLDIDSLLWGNLGWSKWSDYTPCSVTCGKGVQQRFRHCLKTSTITALEEKPNVNIESNKNNVMHNENVKPSSLPETLLQYNGSNVTETKEMNFNISRNVNINERSSHHSRRETNGTFINNNTASSYCEGYNIEQRNCNMFECTDTINLLPTNNDQHHLKDESLENKINQIEVNFTLMMNLRFNDKQPVQQPIVPPPSPPMAEVYEQKHPNNVLSLRSKLATDSSLSINFINDTRGGLKVIQEKYGLSEMLPIDKNLFDSKWHQIALSVCNGGFITIYIDCRWENTFILAKGAIELPKAPIIEVGHNEDMEIQQLTLMPDNKEKLQCSSDRTPITDFDNKLVTQYFENLH